MAENKQRFTAEQRKQQILECAVKVFAQSNFTAAKVSDIARLAGVSEAMIYKHFASKKDIFLQVLQMLSDGLNDFWHRHATTDLSPLEALNLITIRYYQEIMQRPEELRVQFLALSEVRDDEIRQRLQEDYRHTVSFIKEILESGITAGLIRPDIDVNAVANLGLAGGVLTHVMAFLALQEEYTEQLVKAMVAHLIASIQLPEAASPKPEISEPEVL